MSHPIKSAHARQGHGIVQTLYGRCGKDLHALWISVCASTCRNQISVQRVHSERHEDAPQAWRGQMDRRQRLASLPR